MTLKLRALGRVHNSQEGQAGCRKRRKIFENFNLDLMFGLPGQTIQELDEELETAFSFGSTHLSCYQLTPGAEHLFCQISAQRDS